uniref:Sidoreflexin n=1 Tax=Steinernema glaseri TaxID=37863 RepID=A0A1I7ZKF3_9BILA
MCATLSRVRGLYTAYLATVLLSSLPNLSYALRALGLVSASRAHLDPALAEGEKELRIMAGEQRLDVDSPRWDQSTFYGRFRHFASVTDPTVVFVPKEKLLGAKKLLDLYRNHQEPAGTTLSDLYRAQKYFGSAFHPDTGDLQNVAGRMCANVYGSTALCGGMMIFYRSVPGVLFWQWSNQSFNALVNYTNRNAKSDLTTKDLLVAYSSAVTGALTVALGLKNYLAKKAASVTIQRLVPLAAVCVANFINIPLMRQNEIKNGLLVTDEFGNEVGRSQTAAVKAVSLVAFSRNVIAIPSMFLTPLIVDAVARRSVWFKNNLKYLNIPVQLALVFVLFGSMVPVGCGLFPQKNSIDVATLRYFEPENYDKFKRMGVEKVYFNKGL